MQACDEENSIYMTLGDNSSDTFDMFFDQTSHLEEGNRGPGSRFATVGGLALQMCSYAAKKSLDALEI